jgi:hypothetical protein
MRPVAALAVLALSIAWGSPALAQDFKPERTVSGNVISSGHDPAARIRLPKEAVYVGADRWELYGIADCEIHIFVEADAKKVVQRLYWVQFEGYLPSKPDSAYNYKDPVIDVGGSQVFVRASFGPTGGTPREGSDQEHVQALVRKAGYTYPAESLNVRLVRVLDPAKRKELMFIYAEDLTATGLSSADLGKGGEAESRRSEIEKGVIARAVGRIVVEAP